MLQAILRKDIGRDTFVLKERKTAVKVEEEAHLMREGQEDADKEEKEEEGRKVADEDNMSSAGT